MGSWQCAGSSPPFRYNRRGRSVGGTLPSRRRAVTPPGAVGSAVTIRSHRPTVYCDAGGGHRSAADALRDIVRRERRPWQVRQTNLLRVFDELDVWRRLTGARGEDGYNGMLRRGWTLGAGLALRRRTGAEG